MRWRRKPAKAGELKVYYGKDEDGQGPDVCYAWGPGTRRADSSLLHYHFGVGHLEQDFIGSGGYKCGPSFLEELAERGYDLSTIKFSVHKKQADIPDHKTAGTKGEK